MTLETAGAPRGLLEREDELSVLARVIAAAGAGRGGTLAIEGPAGIGKTSLVAQAKLRGQEEGFRVVAARGAELERQFPFGVVRQFFESFLFTVAAEERARWLRDTRQMATRMLGRGASGEGGVISDPAEEFALLHSLYWMCVNIADERPLMMVLDDAQWADLPSLKFVEFLSRRLEQLPLTLVVATRLPDDTTPAPLISVLGDPATELLRPGALSARSVGQLVQEELASSVDGGFAEACHEVTGGNPFLVRELLREILDEGLPATAASADRVRAIGPRGVTRVVLLRLRRMPEASRRLAIAASVAGEGLGLAELGLLAELDATEVSAAAGELQRAELVAVEHSLRFTHPVIRAAIYEDLSAVERSALHLRVAELLRGRGQPDTEVAAHLLHVHPASESWVVEVLSRAAAQAEGAGDFEAAAQMLVRARREPAEEPHDVDLLARLGRAEARAGNAAGVSNLREALDRVSGPDLVGEIAIQLANVLKISGRAEDAAEVLVSTLERLQLSPGPLLRRLQAELLGTRFIIPTTRPLIQAALGEVRPPAAEPSDLLDSFLLAEAAYDSVAELKPRQEAIALGRRALGGDYVEFDPVLGGQMLIVATVALIWSEDFEYVDRRLSAAIAEARTQGAVLGLGNQSTMRAMCRYRAGRLLEAEEDAATVLQLAGETEGLQTLSPPAVAYAVLSGIDRGADPVGLRKMAFDPRLDEGNRLLPFTQLLWARGEVLLTLGENARALEQFRGCERDDPGYGAGNPSMVPWREGAARALRALGQGDEAATLADQAVSRAESFGAPRAFGVALHASALARDGDARLSLLRRAVALLEDCEARLEEARARCDLGAALRAAGKRNEAHEELGRAHRLASTLGALRIVERAAEELTAAGVRPRRELAAGPASLTPSERRVAEMAAAGDTNREIAQTLFITEKTVETHLGHVYDKLGVRSRRKLPDALRLPGAD